MLIKALKKNHSLANSLEVISYFLLWSLLSFVFFTSLSFLFPSEWELSFRNSLVKITGGFVSVFLLVLITKVKRKELLDAFAQRLSAGFLFFALGGTVLITFIPLLLDYIYESDPIVTANRKVFSLLWFSLVAFTPVFEEIVFRGILLKKGLKKLSPSAAILLSALLFGLIHYDSVGHMLSATASGMFFGYVYYKSQSLLLPVLCHSLFNLLLINYPALLN